MKKNLFLLVLCFSFLCACEKQVLESEKIEKQNSSSKTNPLVNTTWSGIHETTYGSYKNATMTVFFKDEVYCVQTLNAEAKTFQYTYNEETQSVAWGPFKECTYTGTIVNDKMYVSANYVTTSWVPARTPRNIANGQAKPDPDHFILTKEY